MVRAGASPAQRGSHLGSGGAAPSGSNTPRRARSGRRRIRGTRRHSGSRPCRRLRVGTGQEEGRCVRPAWAWRSLSPDGPSAPRAVAQEVLTVLGLLLLGREDDGAPWLLGVREGVAVLLELGLGEQVLLEAAVQGGPWGQGRGGSAPSRAGAGPSGRGGWESLQGPHLESQAHLSDPPRGGCWDG